MIALFVFFTIFFIKGLLVSLNLFFDLFSNEWLFTLGGVLDAIALCIIYLSTLKV